MYSFARGPNYQSRHLVSRLVDFHPTKTHLEGGTIMQISYYCLHIVVILFFNTRTDNEVGTSCLWYSIAQNGPEEAITGVPY